MTCPLVPLLGLLCILGLAVPALLLGLLRLLRTPATVALLVIVSAGLIGWLRRIGGRPLDGWMPRGGRGSGGESPRPRRTLAFLLVAVVGAALAPYLLIPLYPPTAFDATMFHLAAAKEFAQQGAIVVAPNLRFPVYSFGVHVLYSALLELGSDLAPALLSTLASALVVLAVLLALRVARVGWGQLRGSGPPPLTDADRERYLSSRFPAYRALLAAPQGGGAVFSLFGSSLAYYSPARFAGDWFGPWPYRTVLAAARSGGRDLHALLTTWGYEYFHVARNRMFSQANAAVPGDEEFRRLFQVVYANEHAELYRLLQAAPPPSPEVQLLRNSGFERFDGAGRGSGWGMFGSPQFDSTGAESRSGKAAVLVDQANTIYQPIAVQPNRAYRLRMFARAASGPGAIVRLQLNWTDLQGKPAGLYLRTCEAHRRMGRAHHRLSGSGHRLASDRTRVVPRGVWCRRVARRSHPARDPGGPAGVLAVAEGGTALT